MIHLRYSCTASLGRERRTASTIVTVLPAASGHSGLILHEQVNIVEVHDDHDDDDDDDDDHGDHGDHVAVFAMVFRKHFRSRKKFR